MVRPEQPRARYPDFEGFVSRAGVRTFYEVYGHGEPTILLLPTWSIIHSRCWRMQSPTRRRKGAISVARCLASFQVSRPSADRYGQETGFAIAPTVFQSVRVTLVPFART